MTIEEYLEKFKIKKAEFGRMLGYTTKQGVYCALKNDRQRPLLRAFLLIHLLEGRGVDIDKLLSNL